LLGHVNDPEGTMKLNPEMVILAREFRELTQEGLARKVGFSQPKVARLENGLADLSDLEAQSVASALSFPLDFFLQDEVRVGFGSSSYFYRKRAAMSASDRKRIQSLVNIKRIHLKRMLSAVDMQPSRSLRRLEMDDFDGTPEGVARALRDYWRLPDGPIADLTAVAESAGIIVLECDFGTREMDGTSLWLGELPPLVFMRRDLPGDRWRFTLAHEIAHLLMHDMPSETMEEEADRFAAELLMPEKDIRPQLARYSSLSIADLGTLKPYWKVAMSALLRRSRDLGYTSENQARYLYQRMSSLGYRRAEPVAIDREAPRVVSKLFACFTEQMGHTAESLAKLLRVSTSELQALYNVSLRSSVAERPRLRLVT
jgi:Zn-dependent peptidase ImmA (M78 family)/transcriptional regulator with XRE-family HTH domain